MQVIRKKVVVLQCLVPVCAEARLKLILQNTFQSLIMQTWVQSAEHESFNRAASSDAALPLSQRAPYNVCTVGDSGKEPIGGKDHGKAFPSYAPRAG